MQYYPELTFDMCRALSSATRHAFSSLASNAARQKAALIFQVRFGPLAIALALICTCLAVSGTAAFAQAPASPPVLLPLDLRGKSASIPFQINRSGSYSLFLLFRFDGDEARELNEILLKSTSNITIRTTIRPRTGGTPVYQTVTVAQGAAYMGSFLPEYGGKLRFTARLVAGTKLLYGEYVLDAQVLHAPAVLFRYPAVLTLGTPQRG